MIGGAYLLRIFWGISHVSVIVSRSERTYGTSASTPQLKRGFIPFFFLINNKIGP